MAVDATQELPPSFQNSVDDIRSLASCKICLRPFYEPFILSCGHTFCYGCLRNWICGNETRKKRKSCPECRATIHEQPAPNYALRDLAHIFTDRAELLPAEETLEEHKRGKVEEARLLADDRAQDGLFNSVFKPYRRFSARMPQSIWDSSDGVRRCPICHWELEGGFCNHCGHDALGNSSGGGLSEDDYDLDDDGDNSILSDESDITIDIPHDAFGANMGVGDMLGMGGYDGATTDDSELDSEGDVRRSWANRYRTDVSLGYGGYEDEDEDDDGNWEDYSDGMGDFIDDGHSHGQGHRSGYQIRTIDESSNMSDYSEGGYSIHLADEDASISADDGTSTVNEGDWHEEFDDDNDDNDDNGSDEDRASTPISHSMAFSRRRGHVIISDDDDEGEDDADEGEHEEGRDDDDDDDDQFEDAVTNHRDTPQLTSAHSARNSRTQNSVSEDCQQDDDSIDSGDDDDDDDDEPIRPAHGSRGRSRQPIADTARPGRSFGSRPQRGGSLRRAGNHAYHPYSRPADSSRSSNSYGNPDNDSRDNSRSTTVC